MADPTMLAWLIPLIVGGAGVGTQIGMDIANQPGPAPKPVAPTGPSAPSISAAVAPQASTIESLTGGSISPDYLSSIAPQLAGVANQPNTQNGVQQFLNQFFGQGGGGGGGAAPNNVGAPGSSPTSSTFAPSGLPTNLSALASTPGVSDFLQKLVSSL